MTLKKADIKDIVSWFDVEKYNYILNLSVRHVLAEIYFRKNHRTFLTKAMNGDFPVFPLEQVEGMKEEHYWDGVSFYDRGIIPVCYGYISDIANTAIDKGILTVNDGKVYIDNNIYTKTVTNTEVIPHDYEGQRVTKQLGDNAYNTGVLIDLGLDLMTDEQILSHIAYHLPKWRELTKTPAPVVVGEGRKIGFAYLQKIYDYKIIPFLDLQYWAHLNDVSITHDIYSRLLFPFDKGECKPDSHIRNTVKPFADSLWDAIYQPEQELFFAKNPGVEDMLFSDFLNLAKNRA